MFGKNGNDKTTISQQISCWFWKQFVEFLPTYNANGEKK